MRRGSSVPFLDFQAFLVWTGIMELILCVAEAVGENGKQASMAGVQSASTVWICLRSDVTGGTIFSYS